MNELSKFKFGILLGILVSLLVIASVFTWSSFLNSAEESQVDEPTDYKIILVDRELGFELQRDVLTSYDLEAMPMFAYDIFGYGFKPIDGKDLVLGDNIIEMPRSENWGLYYKEINTFETFHPRFIYLGNRNCYDKELQEYVECFTPYFNYKGFKYKMVYNDNEGKIVISLPSNN